MSDATAPTHAAWNPSTRVLVCITAAIATVLFLALGVAQLIGIVNAHNNFARIKAPGEKVVWVSTPGRNAVWLERDPKRPVSEGTMQVSVTPIGTDTELPITPRERADRYGTFGRDGTTIGEVDIPARGQYILVARGGGGNNVAIGKVPPARWYTWAWIWFGLAAASLVTTVVSGVIVLRGRRSVDDHNLVAA